MHALVETPQYLADCRAAKLTAEEAEEIVLTVAQNPRPARSFPTRAVHERCVLPVAARVRAAVIA